MFCHKCGQKLPDGAKFCHNCGTEIECPTVSGTEKKIPQNKKKRNAALLAMLVLSLCAIAGIIFVAIRLINKEKTSSISTQAAVVEESESAALLESTENTRIDWGKAHLTEITLPGELTEVTVVSIAPDGEKCLAAKGTDLVIGNINTGDYIKIWADYDNSASDLYGNAQNTFDTWLEKYANPEKIGTAFYPGGVQWSYDSRYISMFSYPEWFTYFNHIDPVIVDTETGGMRRIDSCYSDLDDNESFQYGTFCFESNGHTLFCAGRSNEEENYKIVLRTYDCEEKKMSDCTNFAIPDAVTVAPVMKIIGDQLYLTGEAQSLSIPSTVVLYDMGTKQLKMSKWESYYYPRSMRTLQAAKNKRFISFCEDGQYAADTEPFCIIGNLDDIDGTNSTIIVGGVNGLNSYGFGEYLEKTIETDNTYRTDYIQYLHESQPQKILMTALSPDGLYTLFCIKDKKESGNEYHFSILDNETNQEYRLGFDNVESTAFTDLVNRTSFAQGMIWCENNYIVCACLDKPPLLLKIEE